MTAPERIYLQDAGDYSKAAAFEVTWCVEPQDDDDTEYVRADAVAEMIRQALAAQIEVDARIAEEEGWEQDKPHLGITEREEGSRDCAKRIAAAIRNQPHDRTALDRIIADLLAERDDLRAKLEDAVGALEECQQALHDHMTQYPHMAKGYTVDAEKRARATIAKIKGADHE